MKRGDVVLVQFPHAGPSVPKLRPALVVQADYYNQRISNVLVATITSNLRRRGDRHQRDRHASGHHVCGARRDGGRVAALRDHAARAVMRPVTGVFEDSRRAPTVSAARCRQTRRKSVEPGERRTR
jgi:hypothetical protein